MQGRDVVVLLWVFNIQGDLNISAKGPCTEVCVRPLDAKFSESIYSLIARVDKMYL